MKVTKHGRKYDDGKSFESECDHCGCEVEVKRSEIKYNSDQRDGGYHYVKCPECGHHIYFVDDRLD